MTPGFFKTNPRALTVGELFRTHGLLKLPFVFAASRWMKPLPGGWLPSCWADLECAREELPARFWDATASQRRAFVELGFTEAGLGRLRREKSLMPATRESASITYLDRSQSQIGALTYIRISTRQRSGGFFERVGCSFTAAFEWGTVNCTNRRESFDSLPGHNILRVRSADVTVVHEHFLAQLRRCKGSPRVFPDDVALRCWSDELQRAVLEHWVARGLMVRMTDEEVAEARRKIPPPLPGETGEG